MTGTCLEKNKYDLSKVSKKISEKFLTLIVCSWRMNIYENIMSSTEMILDDRFKKEDLNL